MPKEDTQWKPGQSGNPNGRPKKGTALTDILKGKLDAESLAEALIRKIEEGDTVAIKYAYDRIDGKPIETKHISGEDGGPLEVNFFNIATEADED